MAGISVETGGHGARKSVNAELMLVPMVDLLMVTVAFLLVTAVWSQMSRVQANAHAPGNQHAAPSDEPPPKRLHVSAKEDGRYELTWKTGAEVGRTVIVESPAERLAVSGVQSNRSEKLPALARAIAHEWSLEGTHRDAADMVFDEAVVHTRNELPYSRLVAIIDAVKEPTRNVAGGARSREISAFAVTFAAD